HVRCTATTDTPSLHASLAYGPYLSASNPTPAVKPELLAARPPHQPPPHPHRTAAPRRRHHRHHPLRRPRQPAHPGVRARHASGDRGGPRSSGPCPLHATGPAWPGGSVDQESHSTTSPQPGPAPATPLPP